MEQCHNKDLDSVYKWADENLMEFNEKKFKQMSYEDTWNFREHVTYTILFIY